MRYILRNVCKEDIDQLVDLDNRCFESPWTRPMFEGELENKNTYYLAVDIDGVIVAYGGIWYVLDEGNLNTIAVLPEYRNKGLAKLILNTLLNKAKELDIIQMFLEVRPSNLAAIALYESHGFTEIGLRKNYYGNEDAIVMLLEKK